jgi:hypothetical protein
MQFGTMLHCFWSTNTSFAPISIVTRLVHPLSLSPLEDWLSVRGLGSQLPLCCLSKQSRSAGPEAAP